MRTRWSFLALSSMLVACVEAAGDVDAGRDAGLVMDGGGDGGGTVDAGAPDAGSDAGLADAPAADAPAADAAVGDAVITFAAACPAFTPCGGNLVGTWNYQSICINHDEIVGPFQGTCPGTELLSGSGTASGLITVTDTEITRNVVTSVAITVALGASCRALCPAAAGVIESRLAGSTATCAIDASDDRCHCDVAYGSSVDQTDGYTLAKGTFTTDGGRTFSYCIEGDGSLRYREDGAMPEPGVSTSVEGG